jgi:hypothetical protein
MDDADVLHVSSARRVVLASSVRLTHDGSLEFNIKMRLSGRTAGSRIGSRITPSRLDVSFHAMIRNGKRSILMEDCVEEGGVA